VGQVPPDVHPAPPAHTPSSSLEWLVWLCVAVAVVVAFGLLAASRR
jgi:hypothetical protein